jgi:group I intron endonuclease
MNKSGIYQIQSKIKPERIYIGSAVRLNKRWYSHLGLLRKGMHHSTQLQNHYNKYGESDLQYIVLITCDRDELIKNEQSFIDNLNPWFNVSKTAGSPLGVKHSDKSRKNMSDAHIGQVAWNKGKKSSIETRLKLSLSHKGQISHNKGRKASDATRVKLSLSHMNIKQSIESQIKRSKSCKESWILRRQSPEFEDLRKRLSDIAKRDWERRRSEKLKAAS